MPPAVAPPVFGSSSASREGRVVVCDLSRRLHDTATAAVIVWRGERVCACRREGFGWSVWVPTFHSSRFLLVFVKESVFLFSFIYFFVLKRVWIRCFGLHVTIDVRKYDLPIPFVY